MTLRRLAVSHRNFMAILSTILAFALVITPAQAELSPDAGIEPEEEIKAAVVEKKEVKKEIPKPKPTLKPAPKQEVTAATISAPNLFQENVSRAAANIPAGLTPVVVAEALTVKPGQTAAVTIKTLPGATCNIDVFIINRTPLKATGLEDKVANEEGLCSWQWVVKSTTKRGSWGVKISAAKDGTTDDIWTTLNVGNVH